MKYKADGAGLLKEKYQQLKLLDLSSEDVKTVKKGKQNFIFNPGLTTQHLYIQLMKM